MVPNIRTPLWPHVWGVRSRVSSLVLLALLGLGAASSGCAFDDSRLAELRADQGPLDLGDDLDLGGDADALPDGLDDPDVDAADGPGDPPADPVADPDLVEPDGEPDAPDDVGDDGADAAQDPLVDGADAAQDPVVDAVTDPDAEREPNQPPVITLPATPSVEGFREVAIAGVVVTDPDAGSGLLLLTLESVGGVLSFGVIPGSLSFEDGDGVRDARIEVEGSLANLQTALSSLVYHAVVDGPVTGAITVTVDDQGNTGPGGAQSATDTLDVTIDARQHDFNVQRGTLTMANNEGTATLTAGVDYDAPTGPAFVRVVNTRLAGMGRTSGGNTRDAERWMIVVDASTELDTSIVFRRARASDDCRLSWELIEYRGAAEGGNALEVRATGVADYTEEGLSAAVSVAGVENDDDVVVFITGQLVPTDLNGDTNLGLSTSEWAGDIDEAVFTRGEGGTVAEVSYAVVELTGANWSVNWLEHTYDSAGIAEAQTFTPLVPALEQAFLHVQHRAGASANDELGAKAWIGAVNAVRFELNAGASDLDNAATVAWVIANVQSDEGAMRVEHVEGTRNAGGTEEDIWTEALAQSVVMARWTSLMGESSHADGGELRPPIGSIDLRLIADDTVELRRSENREDEFYRFSVVQWPDE